MTQLRPLYLWKVTHRAADKSGYAESVHYLVLPSRDPLFVEHTLKIDTWCIHGQLPSAIEYLDQVSNLTCYAPCDHSAPVDVQRLQYYNPATNQYANFDRQVGQE